MKIEKVNEQQIRCTLTRSDLSSRQIDLSELAYGTEKTQRLFREMIEQASEEVGFDAEDFPLMIEAVPLSNDCLVLLITKVENPDELDPRFAKFAPFGPMEGGAELSGPVMPPPVTLEELTPEEVAAQNAVVRIFLFPSLDRVSEAAVMLQDMYFGINTLYKDAERGCYYLVATKAAHSPAEFNRVCNILSEYGSRVSCDASVTGFLSEHFTVIVADHALQTMALI